MSEEAQQFQDDGANEMHDQPPLSQEDNLGE
jgi:hypothetical protein